MVKKLESTILQRTAIVLDEDELPVIWVKDFSFESAQLFVKRMIELESDPDVPEIYVFITSYGGEVFGVLAMVEAIRGCDKPVNTVGLGLCASAASVLLASGTGIRWMTKDSFMHIHYVRGGMFGDVPSMEQDLAQTKKVEERLLAALVQRSNMSLKELKERLDKEKREWQLSSTTAKNLGFVDKIGIPKLRRYVTIEAEE